MTGDPSSPSSRAAIGADATETPSIRVVAGRPSPEELAAVTAVLAGIEAEQAARSAERRDLAGPTAWSRSQRPLREALNPGAGQWRHGKA